MPSEEIRAVARESFSVLPWSDDGKEDAARRGRYEFSTTMDAPKPIFAKIARRAESGHIGDEEGRRKKHIAETEPSAAKPKSKRFRYEAEQFTASKDVKVKDVGTHLYLRFHP
jgi:hypothetical protein